MTGTAIALSESAGHDIEKMGLFWKNILTQSK